MYTEQINNKKTDILFKQARGAMLATTLGACIIAFVFREYASTWILLTWITCILAFNGVRQYLIYQYCKDPAAVTNKNSWRFNFNISSLIIGSMWGFMGVYAIATQPLQYSAIMILMSGYLVMGASINYSIFMSSFLSFSLPVIIPVIFSLLMVQDSTINQTYGILLVIFLAYSVISAFRYRSMTTAFIVYEINNVSLLDDLRGKQAETSRLNIKLEEDLSKLRVAEEHLRQEKSKAEELADELMTISSRDGLTGIANRRSFDEFMAREWNRAVRSQTPLSLILCDIDHFKAYNDHFGHQEGDKCLIRIAQILDERARRGGDLAARYGGEEFAIILPETSLENATDIAEQIRKAITDAAILHPVSGTDNIVTMSFGVATTVPGRDHNSRTLIALADKALYQAKQSGRNQVVPSKPGLQNETGIEHKGSA